MHWFIDPIRYHYADFKGRATRSEFWIFTVAITLINGILMGLLFSSIIMNFQYPESSRAANGLMGIVFPFLILSVVTFLPALALSVRRLHDIGFSGLWILVVLIPPPFGMLVFYFLAALPSQPFANKYGPSSVPTEAAGMAEQSMVPPNPPVGAV